jgi:hypothetical protein
MKWIYILLIGTLLLCCSGIASAVNDTVDMSKMVDMDKVKTEAGSLWDSANKNGNTGYVIIGLFAVAFIVVVFVTLFAGGIQSAIGQKTSDANATKEGREAMSSSVKAVVYVVIGLMIIGVFLAML